MIRADQVGSLLRLAELLASRCAFEAGELFAEKLRQQENRRIGTIRAGPSISDQDKASAAIGSGCRLHNGTVEKAGHSVGDALPNPHPLKALYPDMFFRGRLWRTNP